MINMKSGLDTGDINPEFKKYLSGLEESISDKWRISRSKYSDEEPEPNILNLYYPENLDKFSPSIWGSPESRGNFSSYREMFDKIYLKLLHSPSMSLEKLKFNHSSIIFIGQKGYLKRYVSGQTYSSDFYSKDALVESLYNAALVSIVFSKDKNIPAKSRIEALQTLSKRPVSEISKTSNSESQSIYFEVFNNNKHRPRLPLILLDDSLLGDEVKHDINKFCLILKNKLSLNIRPDDANFASSVVSFMLDYPNNSLQILDFILTSVYSSKKANDLLEILLNQSPTFLDKMFDSNCSFFTETDADVFSQKGRLSFVQGEKRPTEENDELSFQSMEDALAYIKRQENKAKTKTKISEAKYQKLEAQNLADRERLAIAENRLNSILNFEYKAQFALLNLNYIDLFECATNQELIDKCEAKLTFVELAHEFSVKQIARSKEALTALNDTQSIEYEQFNINIARDQIKAWLNLCISQARKA